jgi:hypothetical protein
MIKNGADFRFFRTFGETRPSALRNQRKLAGKVSDRVAHDAGSSKVRKNLISCSVSIPVKMRRVTLKINVPQPIFLEIESTFASRGREVLLLILILLLIVDWKAGIDGWDREG